MYPTYYMISLDLIGRPTVTRLEAWGRDEAADECDAKGGRTWMCLEVGGTDDVRIRCIEQRGDEAELITREDLR